MDRRRFLVSAATVAALAAAGRAEAADDSRPGHAGHEGAKAHDPALKALAEVATECIGRVEACIRFCIGSLREGESSLADCLATAVRLQPVVGAMATVAVLDAKPVESTRALAAACAKFCRECEKACEPHYEMHASCRECGESCGSCADRCDAVAGGA